MCCCIVRIAKRKFVLYKTNTSHFVSFRDYKAVFQTEILKRLVLPYFNMPKVNYVISQFRFEHIMFIHLCEVIRQCCIPYIHAVLLLDGECHSPRILCAALLHAHCLLDQANSNCSSLSALFQ